MKRILERARDYVCSTDLEKFSRDMGFQTNHPGKMAFAEEKFVAMKKNFLNFYFDVSQDVQKKIDALLAEPFLKSANYDFESDSLPGITIRVRYEISKDTYGEDRDGNRGEERYDVAAQEWEAITESYENVTAVLWPEAVKMIEEEIEAHAENALDGSYDA